MSGEKKTMEEARAGIVAEMRRELEKARGALTDEQFDELLEEGVASAKETLVTALQMIFALTPDARNYFTAEIQDEGGVNYELTLQRVPGETVAAQLDRYHEALKNIAETENSPIANTLLQEPEFQKSKVGKFLED